VLFLVFQVGQDRYALDTGSVAEVLPLIEITAIPSAPAGIAGMCNYHGVAVPVIDLNVLLIGRPAERRVNTRIVLVHYPDRTGAPRLLGLIAERATETIRRDPGDFVASGVTGRDTPYLGPVATDSRGLLQWVDAGALLPAPVRDVLFAPAVER
jgi:chemotaxis-related protein WspB